MNLISVLIALVVGFCVGWKAAENIVKKKLTQSISRDIVNSSKVINKSRKKLSKEHIEALEGAIQSHLEKL